MEEISKMLKTFGPKYDLRFRVEYFGWDAGLVIELHYFNTMLNVHLKHSHRIPLSDVENMGQYGARIVEDMFMKIHIKLRDTWSNHK